MKKIECKFRIGDVVRFKEKGLAKHTFTVDWIDDVSSKDIFVHLVELSNFGKFSMDSFELVKKCPLEDNDEVLLKAVLWDKHFNDFVVRDVNGVYNAKRGYIEFRRSVMGCHEVPYVRIGQMYDRERHANECDMVFCFPSDEAILAAKKQWEQTMSERIENLEKELLKMKLTRAVIQNRLAAQ